jgi:tRNA C32,U32 (ribose-2'-O)-methylase TrmJ
VPLADFFLKFNSLQNYGLTNLQNHRNNDTKQPAYPASEYILALKITAGRQKDLDDCAILLPKTKIRTRKQAQQVLDRYILASGQQKNAESIENALNRLFGREG